MQFLERHDASKLCRACLQLLPEGTTETQKHDIFHTPDLVKKLVVCTSLNVEPDDGFPEHLCDMCFNKITEFHEFHAMCLESVKRFREALELRGSPALPSALAFEDEKPEFDLEADTRPIITVVESEAIFQTDAADTYQLPKCSLKLQITGRRRRGRPCKTTAYTEAKSNKEQVVRNRRKRNALEENQTEGTVNEQANLYGNCVERDFSDKGYNEQEVKQLHAGNAEDTLPRSKRKVTKKNQRSAAKVTQFARSKRKCRERGRKASTNMKFVKGSVFQCEVCPMRFFVEHRLVAHKRSHEGLVPYPCPRDGCDRSFSRWHCLSEHLKQHEGTNSWYTCEVEGCNKVYKHKPTLVMHQRKYHKRGPELKSHVCEICGKVFKASAILNDHRYTHKDKSELPYACDHPHCLSRFSNKEKLKVHLLRHAGIKNFVCPYCGMRKTTRNELKIHINYHTLERTWPCRFCAHVCNSAGNLKMHVRTVHERAKDYACRFCDRTFAKPDTRKYHEMTHTGEKPNKCTECGKCFTQPAALRTHKKIHLRQRVPVAATQQQQWTSSSEGGVESGSNNEDAAATPTQEASTVTIELHGESASVVLLESSVLPVQVSEVALRADESHLQQLLSAADSI